MNQDNNKTDPTSEQKSGEHRLSRSEYMRRKKIRRRVKVLKAYLILAGMVLVAAAVIFFAAKGIYTLAHRSETVNETAETSEETSPQIEETEADEEIIVCIDPGHGGDASGAVFGDICEKDINLTVALKVRTLLERSGYTVLMTREEDVYVENYSRAYLANDANAAVYVSIHCNDTEDVEGLLAGVEIWRDENKPASMDLAQDILSAIIEKTGAINRGVGTEDFIVTRETTMPSVLVEIGFLNYTEEREKLISDDYQDLVAEGITEGIITWLDESSAETSDESTDETADGTADASADEGTDASADESAD